MVDAAAGRHGFSYAAAASLVDALVAGQGRMAQFDRPEFGGSGQWMRGGMTMIGDMFNAPLRTRVARLCEDLARLIADVPELFARSAERAPAADEGAGNWWPVELGQPDTAGAQNAMRYAYFGLARRLAIDRDGQISIYDTGDHRISGVSQQQSASGTVAFSGQHGVVDLASLRLVSGEAGHAPVPDALATIERLARLRDEGILTEAEFAAKKADLLSRL